MKVGLNYVYEGKADKGLALVEQGIRKGGLKHPEDAKLLLGEAELARRPQELAPRRRCDRARHRRRRRPRAPVGPAGARLTWSKTRRPGRRVESSRLPGMKRIRTDILVLGSGGAGLFAALHAKRAAPSLDVTIAVKGLLGKCGCTRMVQGGYNVALAAGDSIERHFMDTIEGGKWLPDQELAWTLVTKAIERVHELENELGCFFDRNPDGTVHQKAFAGQTFDRTVHKGDLTGIEIINRLAEQVWVSGVSRLEEHRAIELVKAGGGNAIAGVAMIDMRTGELVVRAGEERAARHGRRPHHVPLPHALGRQELRRPRDGASRRPHAARHGDGAVPSDGAARRSRNAHDRHRARGRPARLRGLPPQRRERALHARTTIRAASAPRATWSPARSSPRCAPAAATPNGGVYISMGHLGPAKRRAQFKGMVERCADCGFDLAGGLVEVVPTAHYMMGGVEFGADCRTAIEGLFAAGEDTGGVHGANRLGGNGVANSTVFGAIAGDAMAAWTVREARGASPTAARWRGGARAAPARRAGRATSRRSAKGCTT